jgi:hypothetical protein
MIPVAAYPDTQALAQSSSGDSVSHRHATDYESMDVSDPETDRCERKNDTARQWNA